MTDQTLARTRPQQGARTKASVYIVLTLGALVMLFPLLWQVIMSLSTKTQVTSVPPTFWPGTLQFGNFAEVFNNLPVLSQLGSSVVITAIRTVGQVVLCSLAGYAFARLNFPGRGLIFGAILSLLMVPAQIYIIPQYLLIQDFGLLNTAAGVALPGIFSAFGIFLMRQAFRGLPMELEEAARLDGANPFQIFWRVMLPLVGPTLSALVIVTVLWSWNDLLWPLVVTTRTQNMPISVGLATLGGDMNPNFAMLMAASLIATLPTLILFLALQRRVVQGLASTGIK